MTFEASRIKVALLDASGLELLERLPRHHPQRPFYLGFGLWRSGSLSFFAKMEPTTGEILKMTLKSDLSSKGGKVLHSNSDIRAK